MKHTIGAIMKPAHAFKANLKTTLKASLIALSIAAISPAHATGVPTVDGSAIISNLQQWYQSAQRWYSQMQSMDPGQFATSVVGQQQATSSADSYISLLQQVKKDMQQSNTCGNFKVQASQDLCNKEESLRIQQIDAYITMLNTVKKDYDDLQAKAQERTSLGGQFSAGDALTGGGNTQDGKLKTLDKEIDVIRTRLVANMSQHKEQIEIIDKQIGFTNYTRVKVGKKQFEGDSNGLADLLKKGAVVGVLQSAANDYESDAESIKASGGYKGQGTKY